MFTKTLPIVALLGVLIFAAPLNAQRFGLGMIYPGDGKPTFEHLVGPPHFIPPAKLAGLTQYQLDVMHRQRDRRTRTFKARAPAFDRKRLLGLFGRS